MTVNARYKGTLSDPGKLDLFQNVKTVHWKSGQWIRIIIIGDNGPGLAFNTTSDLFGMNATATEAETSASLNLMFNNAGGVSYDQSGSQAATQYKTLEATGDPYVITADDVKRKFHFSDGKEVTAFGVYLPSTELLDQGEFGGHFSNNANATITFIKVGTGGTKLNGPFNFWLNVSTTGPVSNPALIQIAAYKKGEVAKDKTFFGQLDDPTRLIATHTMTIKTGATGGDHHLRIQVNPTNRAIAALELSDCSIIDQL